MKRILFILTFLCTSAFANAQTNDIDYDKYNFKNTGECKAAEPDVLKLSNTILNSPIDSEKLYRLNANTFLIRWDGSHT